MRKPPLTSLVAFLLTAFVLCFMVAGLLAIVRLIVLLLGF